jgi:hypothetical protein
MMRHLRNLPLLALLATLSPMLHAQEEAPKPAAKKVYPPIATRVIHAGGFTLALRSDTQTLARLSPAGEQSFDFVPGGREAERAGDGYNHIGDLHLRLRIGNGAWQDFASQHQRKAIRPLPCARAIWPPPTSVPRWAPACRSRSSGAGWWRRASWPCTSP